MVNLVSVISYITRYRPTCMPPQVGGVVLEGALGAGLVGQQVDGVHALT
ncbi:hypothetical protein [Embleya sp. NPDC050493]